MRRSVMRSVSFCLATIVSTSCWAESQQLRAYKACTDSYNETYRFLKGSKAIVSGLRNGGTRCFWTHEASTTAVAIERSLSNCRSAGYECFLYHDGERGNRPWVQAISDGGGTDGSDRRASGGGSSSGLDDVLGLATGILGVAGAVAGAKGGGGYSGGGAAGGGSAGGGASCTAARQNAETCRQRWQSLGGGMTGQAGSFYQCYQLYKGVC